MNSFLIAILCFVSSFTVINSAYSRDEPLPTTREDISNWFQEGVTQNATHLLIVCDRFSHEDFPDYVYVGQELSQRIYYWDCQDLFNVMEVYSLHLDLNKQLDDEYRAWH
jgi:hypothetical protein